jgi:hypothetical protein
MGADAAFCFGDGRTNGMLAGRQADHAQALPRGAADVNSVATGHTNAAIHSAGPERTHGNLFAADSHSWINGNVPVK